MSKNIRAYAFASGHIGFTDDALPNGAQVVYLEPSVLAAFIGYVKKTENQEKSHGHS